MAKKYHPDFNTDGDVERTTEIFKKINKAYEVLQNPISRSTYDIENRINDGNSTQEAYSDEFTGKTYYQPRTITDFYHTKWTGYKKPDWFHPYNGHDVRSEYLYRKKLHDQYWYIPPVVDIVVEFIEINRFFFYLLIFFAGDLVRLYFDWTKRRVEKMDLEILNSSFQLDKHDHQQQSLMSMVQSFEDEEDEDMIRLPDDRKEILMQALNNYINERQNVINQERHRDDDENESSQIINLVTNVAVPQ
eukprot:403367816